MASRGRASVELYGHLGCCLKIDFEPLTRPGPDETRSLDKCGARPLASSALGIADRHAYPCAPFAAIPCPQGRAVFCLNQPG